MKNLIKKFDSLKNVQSDSAWKENNRNVLLSQIANTKIDLKEKESSIIFGFSQRAFRAISHPILAACLIVMSIVGVFGVRAAQNTKLGDSLYIAKIVSEKAQLAITFNEDKKNKLGIKFANDRAKEITNVLAELDSSNNDNKKKEEKLVNDFKKEINIVKNKIKEIEKVEEKIIAKEDNQENLSEDTTENLENIDSEVFSANLNKEEIGVQVLEGGNDNGKKQEENINNLATSTEENSEEIKEDENKEESSTDQILNDAEKSFDEKDYNATIDKLNEVGFIIENEEEGDAGEVKGVSEENGENATTTDLIDN